MFETFRRGEILPDRRTNQDEEALGVMPCAGLLAFAAGGRFGFLRRRRSSVPVGVPYRPARWTGAGRIGSRGPRCSLLAGSV